MRTLILLHGYGVRSFFFEPIKTFFESRFNQIFIPDLQMEDPKTLHQSTLNYIKELHGKYPDSEIFIIGHSLGGIIGSIVASELDIIAKLAVIASPYSIEPVKYKSLVRFLIIHQLIPGFLSRPRFFSSKTPKKVQKMLWKQVVPESESMVDELLNETPYHIENNLIKKINQDSIVIGSEYDKVVPVHQLKMLAEKIGATKTIIYPKEKKIAHDDFVTAPIIAQEVSETIIDFFLGKKEIWD